MSDVAGKEDLEITEGRFDGMARGSFTGPVTDATDGLLLIDSFKTGPRSHEYRIVKGGFLWLRPFSLLLSTSSSH